MTEQNLKMNQKQYLFLLLLLFLIFVQAISSIRLKSATVDEVTHLPAGYSYLKTGDFRMGRENPVLIKLISGTPLLFFDLKIPTDHPSWRQLDQYAFGGQFLYHSNKNGDRILFWGRMPIILLSILLAYFVFRWAKELFGINAGLLALFLYIFEPNILAHSVLATTDLGVAVFSFIALYYFWKFIRESRPKNLILAGFTFGLAQASKFSAILLVPIYLLLILMRIFSANEVTSSVKLFRRLSPAKSRIQKSYVLFASLLSIFLIAFLVIFASYGFQIKPVLSPDDPLGKHTKALHQLLPRNNKVVNRGVYFFLERFPIPAADWFRGQASQILHSREGHSAFLMGMYSEKGWWYYYLVAFLIKTPIPLLVLLIIAIWLFGKSKEKKMEDEYFLIVPIAVMFAASFFNRIAIGLRYLLPVYPFLFVFTSRLAGVRLKRQTLFIVMVGILSLWYIFSSLSIYPHYLAYFNEFVGGPNNGYKYLVDSNLDWGQDLKGLAKYVEERKIKEVKLSYFGTASPNYYQIPYQLVTEKEMHKYTPGIYAISATNLQNALVVDKTRFDWFKKYQPVDKIGYSIFIYDIR